MSTRVAASPDTVKKLTQLGAAVSVEDEAGVFAAFSNGAYEAAGATIAPDFATAFTLLSTMLVPTGGSLLVSRGEALRVIGITLALLTSHWLLRDSSLEHAFERLPWNLRATTLALLLVSLILAPGDDRAFIYFQF